VKKVQLTKPLENWPAGAVIEVEDGTAAALEATGHKIVSSDIPSRIDVSEYDTGCLPVEKPAAKKKDSTTE